jgi:hypothetical protein
MFSNQMIWLQGKVTIQDENILLGATGENLKFCWGKNLTLS